MIIDELNGKVIKIATQEYTIEALDEIDSDEYIFGRIDYSKCVISLRNNMPDGALLLTLFHEITHAYHYAWMNTRLKFDSEHFANFTSQMLLSLFKDNPWLIQYIGDNNVKS